MCANTYFDTICVHPLKSAYTLSKMRTVKLTDKLELSKIVGTKTIHPVKYNILFSPNQA